MTTLKKLLGIAGAGLDESYSDQNKLYNVVKAIIELCAAGPQAYQASIATATIGGFVANAAGTLQYLRASVGTTGTADATTVQVHVNGVSKGSVTVDNTDADGTKKVSSALGIAIAAGDLVELVVSAAPTGGADLVASAAIYPVTIE